MSQPERDLLKVVHQVLAGTLTQVQAARLLRLSTRQVRRIRRRLEAEGDQAVVHRLRGRPSNRRTDPARRHKILQADRRDYAGLGPTFASEKLAGQGRAVSPETLRQGLLAEGLWQPRRQRDPHRQRRPRRECFGELVPMDTSIHDWTGGRGEPMVPGSMIGDATSRVPAGFYAGETVEAHLDRLGPWLRRHGRPAALYTDVVGSEVGPQGIERLGQGESGQGFQGEGLARGGRRRRHHRAGRSMSRRALLL
jgi:hypothetical protein